ncbi:kinesin family member 12 [Cavenderia fasciculata]|uniref:Kinesin family member 12 n=1 Tax=Cavenderia fasciculata TaxID=261658 RepID=F4PM32_CACFS|nr:kinesin family member 12 [Cavenderia fasciculata]EGG22735.1 kinesin family member 12 [Cavenderia fasciculata]|eukprot:XP_004360586.1 kinesin family member 12 [Cavenderia fasciculata]
MKKSSFKPFDNNNNNNHNTATMSPKSKKRDFSIVSASPMQPATQTPLRASSTATTKTKKNILNNHQNQNNQNHQQNNGSPSTSIKSPRPSVVNNNNQSNLNQSTNLLRDQNNNQKSSTIKKQQLSGILTDQHHHEVIEPMKVYLRIRPMSSDETKSKETNSFSVNSKSTVTIKSFNKDKIGSNESEGKFGFTHVFPDNTTQLSVFKNVTSPLIKSFLQGHNILLLAYGVTNAGKTYTISGTSKQPGIVPRTLEEVFLNIPKHCIKKNEDVMDSSDQDDDQDDEDYDDSDQDEEDDDESTSDQDASDQDEEMSSSVEQETTTTDASLEDHSSSYDSSLEQQQKKKKKKSTVNQSNNNQSNNSSFNNSNMLSDKFKYSVWVSYYEIYKDQIYDLLDTKPTKQKPALKLETNNGESTVKDLKQMLAGSLEEAMEVVEQGLQARRVGDTKLNSASSRSHSVLTVKLVSYPGDRPRSEVHPSMIKCSRLTIIDLAGSERSKRTDAAGERFKEATNINSSLLSLGRCMEVIRQKGVPAWRESKLTRICQEYFVNNGRVSMIVNVSPTSSDSEETLHVLKFSATAKEITTQSKVDSGRNQLPPPSNNNNNTTLNSTLKNSGSHNVLLNSTKKRKQDEELTAAASNNNQNNQNNNNVSSISIKIIEQQQQRRKKLNDPQVINAPIRVDYLSMEKDQLLDQITKYHAKLRSSELKTAETEANTRESMTKEVAQTMMEMELVFKNRLANEARLMEDRFQHKLNIFKRFQEQQQQHYETKLDSLQQENANLSKNQRSGVDENEWIIRLDQVKVERDNYQQKINEMLEQLEKKSKQGDEAIHQILHLREKLREVEEDNNLLMAEIQRFSEQGTALAARRDVEFAEMKVYMELELKQNKESSRLEIESLNAQLASERREKCKLQEELMMWKQKAEENTSFLNDSFHKEHKEHGHKDSHIKHNLQHLSPFKNIKLVTPHKTKNYGKVAILQEGTDANTIYKGDIEKSVTGHGLSVRFTDTETLQHNPNNNVVTVSSATLGNTPQQPQQPSTPQQMSHHPSLQQQYSTSSLATTHSRASMISSYYGSDSPARTATAATATAPGTPTASVNGWTPEKGHNLNDSTMDGGGLLMKELDGDDIDVMLGGQDDDFEDIDMTDMRDKHHHHQANMAKEKKEKHLSGVSKKLITKTRDMISQSSLHIPTVSSAKDKEQKLREQKEKEQKEMEKEKEKMVAKEKERLDKERLDKEKEKEKAEKEREKEVRKSGIISAKQVKELEKMREKEKLDKEKAEKEKERQAKKNLIARKTAFLNAQQTPPVASAATTPSKPKVGTSAATKSSWIVETPKKIVSNLINKTPSKGAAASSYLPQTPAHMIHHPTAPCQSNSSPQLLSPPSPTATSSSPIRHNNNGNNGNRQHYVERINSSPSKLVKTTTTTTTTTTSTEVINPTKRRLASKQSLAPIMLEEPFIDNDNQSSKIDSITSSCSSLSKPTSSSSAKAVAPQTTQVVQQYGLRSRNDIKKVIKGLHK